MQLAAYCLLIEETSGRAPRYGLLRYRQQTFKLPYTATLRAELLALIEEMQRDRRAQDLPRSHNSAARCRNCGFYADCDDRLG
jgi:CRISPR-associated exonuclease Cas4